MGQEVEAIRTGMGSAHALSAEEHATLERLRSNAEQSTKIVGDLLSVMESRKEGIPTDQLSNLLRAASDAQTKSIDGIAKLTGRDQAPAQTDFAGVLDSLASRGLLRMSVEIGPGGDD